MSKMPPSWNPLRHTEFATIRLRLLTICDGYCSVAKETRIMSRQNRTNKQSTTLVGTIRIRIQDYSFIALIVVVSMMPYVGKLGFYSDDWQFLASMELASNKSLLGTFFAVIVHDYYFRPIQWFTLAVLY